MCLLKKLVICCSIGLIAFVGSNCSENQKDNTDGDIIHYSIGGTVNGLLGTLVLQNNGSDNLTISLDGPFEFSSTLSDQESYSVSIVSSPSNQNCSCANNSGVVNGSDINDIEVTCLKKIWAHPSGLNDYISPNGGAANNPQVAMDDNGNAIITWYQSDGSYNQIFKSEYHNGSWIHPNGLTDNISPDGSSANNPQVAMDNNGNAIITWYQSDGSDDQIFKSEYRNGSWIYPSGITDNISPNGSSANNPQVAMDNNGNAIISWYQSDGRYAQIFKSEYRNGSWIHPIGLNDYISPSGESAYDPQVAMDDNGNAIITWYQNDGIDDQIFNSEYRNGSWSHPNGLNDSISPDGDIAYFPQVAMDNNNNAIITWWQGDGNNPQIFKSEYRNGGWIHPNGLSDNISLDSGAAYDPQVAMDNNGNAIITWEEWNPNYDHIFMSEYRNGVWIHPGSSIDAISLDDTSFDNNPQVSMDDNGNAIITWRRVSDSLILKSEYRNGAWTHPNDPSDRISPDGGTALFPHVAMDNKGNAIIAWYGSNDQIFMSEYR